MKKLPLYQAQELSGLTEGLVSLLNDLDTGTSPEAHAVSAIAFTVREKAKKLAYELDRIERE